MNRTWLVHMWDMTHTCGYMWDMTHICGCMWDMTHICGYMWDMPHTCVDTTHRCCFSGAHQVEPLSHIHSHGSSIFVTNIWHMYVTNISVTNIFVHIDDKCFCIFVTICCVCSLARLMHIHTCVWHPYVWHGSFTCEPLICVCDTHMCDIVIFVTRPIYPPYSDVLHPCVCDTHMCDMVISVTHLIHTPYLHVLQS